MQTLLRTGFGLTTSWSHFETLSVSYVKGLLMNKGFIVVKNTELNSDALLTLSSKYGVLAEYIDEKKKEAFYKGAYCGHKYILEVDGSEKKKVRGRGELPLHADGGLLRKPIDIIFLYAKEIANLKLLGGTGIVDHKLAIDEMPLHLRRVLEEEKFETVGLEEPYFSNVSKEDWLEIPVFTDLGWVRKMLIYVNYADQSGASWKTRIAGFNEAETSAFFKELDKFLKRPKYCYLHFWSKGDLMLVDNRRAIHYREAFATGTRLIQRVQASACDASLNVI